MVDFTREEVEAALEEYASTLIEEEEVEFLIEDSVDIIGTFLNDRESAVKAASERRIIDVI